MVARETRSVGHAAGDNIGMTAIVRIKITAIALLTSSDRAKPAEKFDPGYAPTHFRGDECGRRELAWRRKERSSLAYNDEKSSEYEEWIKAGRASTSRMWGVVVGWPVVHYRGHM